MVVGGMMINSGLLRSILLVMHVDIIQGFVLFLVIWFLFF